MRKSGLINLGFVLGVLVMVGGMSMWLRESVLSDMSAVAQDRMTCPTHPMDPSECRFCDEKHRCKRCCRTACGGDKECLKDCRWDNDDEQCITPTGSTGPTGV